LRRPGSFRRRAIQAAQLVFRLAGQRLSVEDQRANSRVSEPVEVAEQFTRAGVAGPGAPRLGQITAAASRLAACSAPARASRSALRRITACLVRQVPGEVAAIELDDLDWLARAQHVLEGLSRRACPRIVASRRS